jgi:hypothetical protein
MSLKDLNICLFEILLDFGPVSFGFVGFQCFSKGAYSRFFQKKGVKISAASTCEPNLSEAIQDINYATLLTFNSTGAYKMFENHLGTGMYKVLQQQVLQLPVAPGQRPPNQNPGR